MADDGRANPRKAPRPTLRDLPRGPTLEVIGWLGVREAARTVAELAQGWRACFQVWLAAPGGRMALWLAGVARTLGLDGQDLSEPAGRRLVEEAAARGCACAEAFCNLEGWGGRVVDFRRALNTLRREAVATTSTCDGIDKNPLHRWAVFLLGYCLYHGYGTPGGVADHHAAVPYYRRAAEAGLCVAQNHLALMLQHGEGGLSPDPAQCKTLLARAAAQGNCRARYGLGMAFRHEDGCEDDGPMRMTAAAVRLFEESAMQGHDEAQYELALRCAALGQNAEAVLWMRRAARQGTSDGRAEYALGHFHASGLGPLSPPDKCAALKWYTASAQRGNPDAQFSLGSYHLYGYAGLRASPAQALAFFQMAARAGHAQAASDAAVLVELGIEPA